MPFYYIRDDFSMTYGVVTYNDKKKYKVLISPPDIAEFILKSQVDTVRGHKGIIARRTRKSHICFGYN